MSGLWSTCGGLRVFALQVRDCMVTHHGLLSESLMHVLFAEKVLLNGVAAYITEPAAQITFALLTSALLLLVQVHFNPYKEADARLLAKLLTVSTFMTLLLGAHIQLMVDTDETADTKAVQMAIMGFIGAFVSAAFCIIVYGIWQPIKRVRKAHRLLQESEQGAAVDAPRTRAPCCGWLSSKVASTRGRLAKRRRRRLKMPMAPVAGSEAEVATQACQWVLHSCCPIDSPLPSPNVVACLNEELARRFGSMMVGAPPPSALVKYHIASLNDPSMTQLPAPAIPRALRKSALDCETIVNAAADMLPTMANPLLRQRSDSASSTGSAGSGGSKGSRGRRRTKGSRRLTQDEETKLDRLVLMHARSAAAGASGAGQSERGKHRRGKNRTNRRGGAGRGVGHAKRRPKAGVE